MGFVAHPKKKQLNRTQESQIMSKKSSVMSLLLKLQKNLAYDVLPNQRSGTFFAFFYFYWYKTINAMPILTYSTQKL